MVRKQGWPTASKTFRTKRDAEDWSRSIEDEMVRGVYLNRAPAERTTLQNALQRYLLEVTVTKKQTTQTAEKRRADRLIEKLGNYSLASLTAQKIAEYRDNRLKLRKSPDTVRLELALLSHLYTVAIQEWGLGVSFNPVLNIRKPSPSKGRDRRLSVDEEKKLLEVCNNKRNPKLGWMTRLALSTGMRAGEIQSLERNQIDLKKRVIRLSDTKNGNSRTVPLNKVAVSVLNEVLSEKIRPFDTNLVFYGEPGKDGKRRPYQYRPAWRKAIAKAKLHDLRFHDLRHEAISRLVEAGLGDQEVAAISGHKSMQMLKRYTHLRAEDLVSKLDQLNIQ